MLRSDCGTAMAFWGRFSSGHNTDSSAGVNDGSPANRAVHVLAPAGAAGQPLPRGNSPAVNNGRPLTSTQAFGIAPASHYRSSRPGNSGGLLGALILAGALIMVVLADSHTRKQLADAFLSSSSGPAMAEQAYFQIGSTKEEVTQVQGAPTDDRGSVWRYGRSEVRFAGDRVYAWRSSPANRLKTLPSVSSFSLSR
jgi:hypothetical protein